MVMMLFVHLIYVFIVFFFFIFFFFFQAEDGIRDLIVTGVQTCALPISQWPRCRLDPAGSGAIVQCNSGVGDNPFLRAGRRSEERRVGKECRSRWWADY